MKNKPLLSIAILTYNRAACLENLLNHIVPQAAKFRGEVEICISNNDSSDNTQEVVMSFKEKYPDLINYNKNEKNIGFDKNILKIIEISNGDFILTFGDDDSIADNGVEEVIEVVRKSNKENTGLITTRVESYFIDKQTGQRVVCGTTFDKNKPETFKTDKKDIIGTRFRSSGFMSVLIFNNRVLKKIIEEDKETIEKATGVAYMHILLRSFMFLKYPYLDAITLNKTIVLQELPCYKFFIEDKFIMHYRVQKKMNNLILSYKYMDKGRASLIVKINKKLRGEFIVDMIGMRAFKNFNYFSYIGCLKLFFQHSTFIDALIFSFVFSILFLIPPIVLIFFYKVLLMIKYGKKWKVQWFLANNFISITTKGTTRQSDTLYY